MKSIIEVTYHATIVRMSFLDAGKAKEAYDKISQALKEYQRFKNDRVETIEIENEDGLSTLKLERMDAVLFNAGAEQEKHLRASLQDEKLMIDLREELGLPPSPIKPVST